MDEDIHKAEVVLEVLVLRRRIDLLAAENKLLKNCLHQPMFVGTKKQTEEQKAKWLFYHEHKSKTLSDICNNMGVAPKIVSWRLVKAATDKEFYENSL